MSRRLNGKRLMQVMAVLVLLLGALSAYAAFEGQRWSLEPADPGQRMITQVRSQMGPGAEVRHAVKGQGRVMCGYAGYRGRQEAIAFISRPNRILFETDPLHLEFAAMKAADCRDLPEAPSVPKAANTVPTGTEPDAFVP